MKNFLLASVLMISSSAFAGWVPVKDAQQAANIKEVLRDSMNASKLKCIIDGEKPFEMATLSKYMFENMTNVFVAEGEGQPSIAITLNSPTEREEINFTTSADGTQLIKVDYLDQFVRTDKVNVGTLKAPKFEMREVIYKTQTIICE